MAHETHTRRRRRLESFVCYKCALKSDIVRWAIQSVFAWGDVGSNGSISVSRWIYSNICRSAAYRTTIDWRPEHCVWFYHKQLQWKVFKASYMKANAVMMLIISCYMYLLIFGLLFQFCPPDTAGDHVITACCNIFDNWHLQGPFITDWVTINGPLWDVANFCNLAVAKNGASVVDIIYALLTEVASLFSHAGVCPSLVSDGMTRYPTQ